MTEDRNKIESRITGKLARAARALVELPRDRVARLACLDETALAAFETGTGDLGEDIKWRLRHSLEENGATFLFDDGDGGVGVRLKFNARDVRALNRLEGEGGRTGNDDV